MVNCRNSRRSPSAILDFATFYHTGLSHSSLSMYMPNLKSVVKTIQKLWSIVEIQDGHRPPSWIFRFCYFLPYGSLPLVNVYVHEKFEVSSSNGSKVMANRNLRWPPTAILDFQILLFLPHHTSFYRSRLSLSMCIPNQKSLVQTVQKL